ncbi:MAG: 16S rRNA (cytosine(1402)-N(4))-methyltransferase RsmH [Alphaproteobacteria bacterium]|nr:16S rRNA (cytosine(1402)-N(4))-methyltransferase RsmH [Alphaproteobacteria bacterium]
MIDDVRSDPLRGEHAPVLLDEVLAALAPSAGETVVDGTLGGGGYARAFLDAGARTIGFDRDPTAIARSKEWAGRLASGSDDRFTAVEAPFADFEEALDGLGVDKVDAIALDLGVSSMQFDQPERGFSFRNDGKLSMRMDGGRPDAGDVVNSASVDDLAAIFRVYGEERFAGRIARAIVAARADAPIVGTLRLAAIVEGVQPKGPPNRIHPATRAFQALRIFVNDELAQLAAALGACERVLAPGGRLAVVTFHSLEDRIVKRFIAAHAAGAAGRGSRHAPVETQLTASFEPIGRKPITPAPEEVLRNPRARSAKLRAARRTAAPPLNLDPSTYYSAPAAPSLEDIRS